MGKVLVSDNNLTAIADSIRSGLGATDKYKPADMAAAITNVGATKYDSGRTQGQNDVTSSPNNYSLYTKSQYDANYSSGRTQGQNDVKNSPNNYGLYSSSQYTANYNNGRTQGRSDVTSNPNNYSLYSKSQYDANYSAGSSANGGYSMRIWIEYRLNSDGTFAENYVCWSLMKNGSEVKHGEGQQNSQKWVDDHHTSWFDQTISIN